jgi:flagellin
MENKMLTVRTNMAAISSINQLGRTQGALSSSLEKISSGMRINKAGDDAAGLGVATRMESDNTSLKQAIRNTNDGISMLQTAEGSLQELSNILVRMRELSVQASNETYSSDDRTMIQTELSQLKDEYVRIVTTANFNRINLLNEATDTSYDIQVGIQNNTFSRISVNLVSLNATLGNIGMATFASSIASAGNLTQARTNIDAIDDAITSISTRRARLGALQNRMENALSEATNYSQNLSASASQIRDVDYASESANMTRYQIQQQAGVAALAQAKSMPQSIISLLS